MSYSNDRDPRRLNGPDPLNPDAAQPHPSPRGEAGHAPCERSEAHAPRQQSPRPKGAHAPSPARQAAARANGAKSKGPITPEGKARSSRNALKHGLLAEYVVLEEESEENFAEFAAEFHDFLQPANPVARMLVDDLVAANWRRMRVRSIEAEIFNVAVDDCKPASPSTKGTRWRKPSATSPASRACSILLNRYETRFDRQNLSFNENTVQGLESAG